MKPGLPLLVSLLISLLGLASLVSAEEKLGYRAHPFELPASTRKIAPADIDGDGRSDLVIVEGSTIRVHRQSVDGFDFSGSVPRLQPPGRSLGWHVVDLDGNGGLDIVTLTDGREVHRWPLTADHSGFGPPQLLAGELRATVPGGFYHLAFARDVDGDGDADLILPGNGVFHLHLRAADGTYQRGPTVQAEMDIDQRLEPEGNLLTRIGQSIRIPLFTLRDVNADDRVDLVVDTEDVYQVYLSSGEGTFPASPSYSIDLAARREKLGPIHGEDFDTSNIMSPLTRMVQLMTQDIDGNGTEDVLVRAGGTVDLFRGTERGIDPTDIDQRLKASGNVVAIALADENLDGKSDLWMIRVETVSLAGAMLWLVAPGSIDFDFLIYHFETERFAKRYSRRIQLKLKFPALLSFLDEMQDIGISIMSDATQTALTGDLSGQGKADDIVVLDSEVLRGYLGRAQAAISQVPKSNSFMDSILQIEDYSPDRDRYTIDLENIRDLMPRPGEELLDAVDGRTPDLQLEIPGADESAGLFVLELNGDGRDDFLVILARDEESIRGTILLSETRN